MKIDLGSGRSRLAGYVTIDHEEKVRADVTAEITDLPFDDGAVDEEVRAHHILEHLEPKDTVRAMREIDRVMAIGCELSIEVPRFPHAASVQDPDHKSFWCFEKLAYFTKDNKFGEAFSKRADSPLFKEIDRWERGEWAVGVRFRKI